TASPANRTTKARTMMSAAPRCSERSLLITESILPKFQIEVAIVNSDPLRCLRWEQLASLRGLARLRDRFYDAFPLKLKTADPSLSISSATAVFEVWQFGGKIEN